MSEFCTDEEFNLFFRYTIFLFDRTSILETEDHLADSDVNVISLDSSILGLRVFWLSGCLYIKYILIFIYVNLCNINILSYYDARQTSTSDSNTERKYDLPMRILIVKCQSIKNPGKKALLQNMIDSNQVDIVIGIESWLDVSIKSSGVFPINFRAYRKYRDTGRRCGGMFVLISDKYQSDRQEEIVLSKIKVTCIQDLYVGAFYKPPSSTD